MPPFLCEIGPFIGISFQVVESGSKNIEIAIMRNGEPLQVKIPSDSSWLSAVQLLAAFMIGLFLQSLSEDEVERYCAEIEKAKKEAEDGAAPEAK